MKRKSIISLCLTTSLVLCSCSGNQTIQESPDQSNSQNTSTNEVTAASTQESTATESENTLETGSSVRNFFLGNEETIYYNPDLVPSVPQYEVAADLSNVDINKNLSWFFSGEYPAYQPIAEKLAQNYFVVWPETSNEFYEIYEANRYNMTPSFVTVDSLMHTYHLYFSYLMKKTEKGYLAESLKDLTGKMLEISASQYQELKGTDWENAAARNVAYFDVAASLLGVSTSVQIDSDIASTVQTEVDRINAAEGIEESLITGVNEDYTQYIVRGYYEGDEELEAYFKAMMWYGRMSFKADDEDLDRSALLINLAIEDSGQDNWENIYQITSFFAGASDDCGYYEYIDAIENAYSGIPTVAELSTDETSFKTFCDLTKEMKAPRINSIAVNDGEDNVIVSYRFMGQRFTIDEAIFQNLIYQNVKENSNGDKRMLPDALDVPAALGSDVAYDILSEEGKTQYEGYDDNLKSLQDEFNTSDQTIWNASLYSNWLYTLRPLLDEKGEGYPSYMTTDEWSKKNLETFEGSYAELKHDTILYSKQSMAEMGGEEPEELDDRGYVDPQPVVYSRFINLANNTRDGLDSCGMLGDEDRDNLNLLSEMAMQLLTISEKELVNESLSDDEYDFIRCYGGNLEHFWYTVFSEGVTDHTIQSEEAPCPVVADVATDPNGSVLEVGTGYAHTIFVIAPVEGELRICRGSVYSFYEFEQPISERLTDTKWRQMISSYYIDDDYNYVENDNVMTQPDWTQSYRAEANWDD